MKEQKRRRKKRQRGGGFVTFCIVASGLIAGFKRIPLTNLIGDNGNACFGIAYDTYLFFFLLCGYSIQSVTASMISSRTARGQYRNAAKVWRILLIWAACGGFLTGALMFLLSGPLAAGIFRTRPAQTAVQFMAVSLLFSAPLGLYRGYFQGMGSMVPTAMSRFLEELVCFVAMLRLAPWVGGYGKQVGALLRDPGYEQAFGAAGGLMGIAAGEAAAFLFLLILHAMFQGNFRRREQKDPGRNPESTRRILRVALLYSFPIVLTGFTVYGSFLLDQLLYLRIMPATTEHMTDWGIYTGKYRILSGLPAALVTSACAFLAPLLSSAHASRNAGRLREHIQLTVRFALMLVLPMAAYFAIMSDTLMSALFTRGDTATAAGLLRAGSAAIVLQGLGVAFASVLQALNRKKNMLINSVAALAAHTVFLYLLLAVGKQGIMGVVYAVILLYAVYLLLNLISLGKQLLRLDWGRIFAAPVMAAGISGLVLFLLNRLLSGKIDNGPLALLGLLIGGIIYMILLFVFHGMSEREWKELPGGHVMLRIGRAFRLL